MSGYADFSQFYDRLTENVSYDEIAEHYSRLIERYGVETGTLTDLACGTGSLSVRFAQRGWKVTGVDASEDMLCEASSKPCENVVYIMQTMQELKLHKASDVTICSLDSINHLSSTADIQKAFDKAAEFTSKLFLFDINTPYKHRNVLGNNTFVYDLDDLYCVWQNEFSEKDCRVDMYLDFFVQEGELYERYCDELSEIAPEIDEIEKMLRKSGFTKVEIFDYLSEKPCHAESEKVTVAAIK